MSSFSLSFSLSLVPDVGRRSFLVRVCVPSPVPPPPPLLCGVHLRRPNRACPAFKSSSSLSPSGFPSALEKKMLVVFSTFLLLRPTPVYEDVFNLI